MAREIILPALGETMDEGTIARWLVDSGSSVSKGQAVAEIESNKAVFELEAPASGTLLIRTAAGASVPILTVIGAILAAGESAPQWEAMAPGRAAPTNAEAPVAAAVGPVLGAQPGAGRQFVSPRARRFAREHQVNTVLVAGTGPQGRVEERDVRAYLEAQPRLSPLARKVVAAAGVAVPAGAVKPGERVTRADVEQLIARAAPPAEKPAGERTPAGQVTAPMDVVRRVIAQRMSQSAQMTASVTLTTETDATELVHLREQIKGHIEQQTGESLSYDVLLAKLVAIALGEFPYMTSKLAGDRIAVAGVANIGVAVETERGLLVPVLRDAGNKGLVALSQEASALMRKARTGALSADDMAGGTFTLTNLGMYGIDAFTPIINLPECAILGVGRIVQRPAAWQGQVALRHMVVLSLTFDHRLVDGAPAARFLQRVAELVQNPYVVLL